MSRPRSSRRHTPRQQLTREEIAEIAWLLAEITTSLHDQLTAARLRAANLEAAMRAALSADSDGEPDPLSYLRDELAGNPGGADGA